MATISQMAGMNMNSTIYGKMASGNRIQTAKDDAAGLAISEKMEAQQREASMRARNAMSEVDMAKVADGAMASATDYMQDMNSLSIQSLNGTNSESDLNAIENQQVQYASGVDQIGQVTKYNETNPVSGVSARSLGVGANFNTDDVQAGIEKVSSMRAENGAKSAGFESVASVQTNIAANTQAAQSRVKDLEYGQASSEKEKEKTLQEARFAAQRQQIDDAKEQVNKLFNG